MAREAAPVIDRFRRPVFPGVKVEFHARLPVVYTVVGITPILDPRVPAGVHKVTLTATVDFQVAGGVPVDELTAVIYPPTIDVDAKPAAVLPSQTDDSPAGASEYFPPGEQEKA